MANIFFYGSHNASFVVEKDGKILSVIELERFQSVKNVGIAQYKASGNPMMVLKLVLEYIERTLGISHFESCYFANTYLFNYGGASYHLHELIPANSYLPINHHESHANAAFYQSDFDAALVFSFDAGGNDGKFNVYLASRENSPTLLESVINPELKDVNRKYDLGFPYMCFGHFLGDITFESLLGEGNLVYPGKIMGLASYGNVKNDWLPHFISFYKSDPQGPNYMEKLALLSEKTGVLFNTNDRLFGQTAYDVAATSQKAFEECFLEVAIPFMEQYPDLPVCMSGGCALNILLNTRLVEEFNRNVFVPPNPNDCGIATGAALGFIKPEKALDLTYSGMPLKDSDSVACLATELQSRLIKKEAKDRAYECSEADFVEYLVNGDIIGIVRGDSEHGPRALGNRSILCHPGLPGMKDKLNRNVKNREWYRPFAPVVRLEDVSKYFYWEKESRWMTFCPKVREEYLEVIPAVVHVDGTARVQTVTREQNEWLYDLLTEFEKRTGVGVLLNTSFNVAGRPILSTAAEAVEVLLKTELDGLLIEDLYLRKSEFR